jgi:hypothetical protein
MRSARLPQQVVRTAGGQGLEREGRIESRQGQGDRCGRIGADLDFDGLVLFGEQLMVAVASALAEARDLVDECVELVGDRCSVIGAGGAVAGLYRGCRSFKLRLRPPEPNQPTLSATCTDPYYMSCRTPSSAGNELGARRMPAEQRPSAEEQPLPRRGLAGATRFQN